MENVQNFGQNESNNGGKMIHLSSKEVLLTPIGRPW